jgi:hypothetical protein
LPEQHQSSQLRGHFPHPDTPTNSLFVSGSRLRPEEFVAMIWPAGVALSHPQRNTKLVEVLDERQPALDIFTSTVAVAKMAFTSVFVGVGVLVVRGRLWWGGPFPIGHGVEPPKGSRPPVR